MAGSRAADAREPGQIREEAALSDTVRAPRISLAGADDRRARPGAGFKGGCTVRCRAGGAGLGPDRSDGVVREGLGPDRSGGVQTMSEERNVEVVRRLAERWNAGDSAGVLELYADDIVMVTAPEWPDTGPFVGKQAVERSTQEWRSAWELVQVDLDRLEAAGDMVVVEGGWDSRGLASGASGRIPFGLVFTVRDGLIARLEWFMDPVEARRAAGLA
jgi:ketosteroid isomerase-like protein